MIKLSNSSISNFQWSTAEQVWPFEKDSSGRTLYCKEINFGALPNNTNKLVPHGISNLDFHHKVFKVEVFAASSYYNVGYPVIMPNRADLLTHFHIDATNIVCVTGYNNTEYDDVKVRITWAK